MNEREAFLYATLPMHKRLVDRTKTFISDALAKVQKPYVACSFGKDSGAMLHLVKEQVKNIPVIYVEYPESELIDNYEEIIEQWNCNLFRIFINLDIEQEINEADIIPKFAINHGFDAGFVGIRSEESNGRRISLKKHGLFYRPTIGPIRICPLADWTIKDVAAYTIENKLPILNTYKMFGFQERTVNGIANDEYGFRQAQLLRIKQTDVSRFNLILKRYPILAKYA